ncbi:MULTISPECIES: Spo0E family sporulation regulatory protein-aspartic acid phosphatase [unclassified Paenibacillus]|uniref:Spo0E family sporulation regulatory protein-aspartic acid phosphatase n=1 Tax=unclassified Paenibacillus TaxID=185978 RepID=UPI0036420FD5
MINNLKAKVSPMTSVMITGLLSSTQRKPRYSREEDESILIEEAIYEKRRQLNKYAEAHGHTDPGSLRYSMELDDLINAFNRSQKKTTD